MVLFFQRVVIPENSQRLWSSSLYILDELKKTKRKLETNLPQKKEEEYIPQPKSSRASTPSGSLSIFTRAKLRTLRMMFTVNEWDADEVKSYNSSVSDSDDSQAFPSEVVVDAAGAKPMPTFDVGCSGEVVTVAAVVDAAAAEPMPTFDIGCPGEQVTVAAQAHAALQQAVVVAAQQKQQLGAGPLDHSGASPSAAPTGQGQSAAPSQGPPTPPTPPTPPCQAPSAAASQAPSDDAQSQSPAAVPSHGPAAASCAPSQVPAAMHWHSQPPTAVPTQGLESQTAAPSPLSEVEANNLGSLGPVNLKRRRDDVSGPGPVCPPKSKRAFVPVLCSVAAAFAIAGRVVYSYGAAPQDLFLAFD